MIGALMVGANIVSPRYQLVTGKPYVDHAHSLGLKVIPWTVNDADAMREQIGYGVDGIITDYPNAAAPRAGRPRHAAAAGLPSGLVSVGIASAQSICPSKPSDFAMSR